MGIYTNISTGARGLYTAEGALVMVEAGQSVEGDFADVNDEWFADGEVVDDSLASKKVIDLKAIAEAEGVDLEGLTKKADIVAAIELARDEAAQAE